MIFSLPAIVCGRLVGCEGRECTVIEAEGGDAVRLPVLTPAEVDEIIASRLATGLHETHLDDLSIAFARLAERVTQPRYPLRDEAVAQCSRLSGYDPAVVLRDYVLLAYLYKNRCELYDQLDAELGNRWYLEEWLPSQTCIVHAQPLGLVTSVLVGNIPIASAFGALRGLLVKNNVVCKLPRRDPVSALFYGRALVEAVGDGPISRSVSMAYWERDSETERRILGASDAVCVWGGEQAVAQVKRKVGAGTRVLEYGPKRSLCLVDLRDLQPGDSLGDVALRAASDLSVYDQEACFTAQEVYVAGGDELFERFLAALEEGLRHFLKVHPKGRLLDDNKAHVLLTRKEQLFFGERVIATEDHGFTIVVKAGRERLRSHPLARTAFVHRVASLEEALPHVNRSTQTVTIYPWRASEALREGITFRGADRIASIGMANYPRTGWPHDGLYTLNQLVRWVSVERDIDFKGKFYDKSRQEFHDMLFERHLLAHG